jgi:Domain of unknown function (DUF4190)
MDTTLGQIQPIRKYNGLAIASFVLGMVTIIFPIISAYYLIAANGGPGYLQSIFCGVPVALASISTGSVSLVQIRRQNQSGAWMAVVGMVVGILSFGIMCIMAADLIIPFLFSVAG